MVRQAVWIGGQWQVQEAFPASNVTAMAATEVGGRLAIVWADNKAQRVFARLSSFSVTK